MSKKHKSFDNLSSRQKRRKLCEFPGSVASNIDTESESSAGEIGLNDLAHNANVIGENDMEIDNNMLNDEGEEVEELRNDNNSENSVELNALEPENVVDSIEPEDPEKFDESEEGEDDAEPEDPEELEELADPEYPEDPEEPEVVEEPEDPAALRKKILKNAFLAAGLKHTQGNIILKTLREFPFSLIHLPKDTRTLLNTPTDVASRRIDNIAGGEYLHIGLKSTMKKKLENLPADKLPPTVEIDFSTDGAKVNKGLHQFWPHQYRILNIADNRPIIAGIYKGIHKPLNPFDFYDKFQTEILEIQQEGGIRIKNQLLPLNVRRFIADTAARGFALNHVSHNSSNPCSKCDVEGYHFEGRMVFTNIDNVARTDENYRNATDEDHHKGRSPLADILGLVTKVPFEIMHLVYLGITKKICAGKLDGNFGHSKLNGRKINILDSRMEQLSNYCQSEFNRRPRKISLYKHYKATEFRQLLLYTAPAVLKNVFDEDDYLHFMMLHSSMRLLNSEDTPREMYELCRQVLRSFVSSCLPLYGEQFFSYNVHGLLQVADDVEELGPAETFSAFSYENNMPTLRKLIRKPHLTLQQIHKRLSELNDNSFEPLNDNTEIRPSLVHADGPLLENMPAELVFQQFKKLEIGELTLSVSLRDNCCTLTDSRICLIENILQINEELILLIREFRTIQPIYDVGIKSNLAGVYHCMHLSERLEAVNLREIKSKVYRIPEWSSIEGEEEEAVENKWICVKLLSQIILPQN